MPARRKGFPRRLALGSLTALLLLSGCVSNKNGLPSDDGGPFLTEAPAAGQDLSLRQENLDQCAGFSEETGYGGLEQPLEQIFEYRRSYLDGRCYEIFVPENRSEEVLLLELPDGTRQELHIQPETYMAVSWDLRREDLNFDGYPDLALDIGGGNGGRRYADALLWDETAQVYREESSFTRIPSPVLDPEHSIIWGGYDVNWLNYRCAYEMRDGVFTETHALAAEPMEQANWPAGFCCTEYALLDDGWSEINRLEFSYEENPVAALDRYLEAGPVWSGWLWADMHWHEQHG